MSLQDQINKLQQLQSLTTNPEIQEAYQEAISELQQLINLTK